MLHTSLPTVCLSARSCWTLAWPVRRLGSRARSRQDPRTLWSPHSDWYAQ